MLNSQLFEIWNLRSFERIRIRPSESRTCLLKHLEEVLALSVAERLKKRYEKFRAHGHFLEKAEDLGEMKSTKTAEPVPA